MRTFAPPERGAGGTLDPSGDARFVLGPGRRWTVGWGESTVTAWLLGVIGSAAAEWGDSYRAGLMSRATGSKSRGASDPVARLYHKEDRQTSLSILISCTPLRVTPC